VTHRITDPVVECRALPGVSRPLVRVPVVETVVEWPLCGRIETDTAGAAAPLVRHSTTERARLWGGAGSAP